MRLHSRRLLTPLALLLAVFLARGVLAAEKLDLSKLVDRPDEWFKSDEGRRIADNVVSWQNANGGWWKAYDVSVARPAKVEAKDDPASKAPANDREDTWHRTSTIDNKATFTELRFLARAFRVNQEPKYRAAFERGMKFLFDAQYPNGGWPQRFPVEENYGRHITFNDNAMVGVMRLMEDVASGEADFAWVGTDERERAKSAFGRGIGCILDAQI